ncbi:MAG: DNA-directed RNA polymerase subunit alpha [Bacilli bacterium]|nr:DNA-directed RNA polymerase subunit alpha [Bacillales bacterium]MDY2575369.1 DNA-directed RNA polymerase subunit alpha [Bacilli bacterium]
MKKFEKPEFKIAEYNADTHYGHFVIEPLERGFGTTLGNALRRVLLSSLPGASVYAIEVEGARHEFSSLEGVEEDVTSIVLNLKDLVLKIDDETESSYKLTLCVTEAKEVTAGDIVCPTGVEIINKDLVIAHVNEGGRLVMTIHARNGRGYVTAEGNKDESFPIGVIPTDSNYSPITKCSCVVENTRVGHNNNYDKLEMEIWTNGSMQAHEAIALAAKILVTHFELFVELSEKAKSQDILAETVEEPKNKYQDMTIEELDLSVRSYNCLKRANIATVIELTQKTEEDMMKVRNLGKKSLKEVKEKLQAIGLGFREYE